MRRLSSMLLVAAFALALAGCMQHTFVVGTGAPVGEIAYKHWHHHWLFGLIRPKLQKQVDIDKLCPSGNAVIHEETSFANGIIDLLTSFIYSPTTVTITCDAGEGTETATLLLSEEEVVAIGSDPGFKEVVKHVAPDRLAELDEALAR